MGRDDLYITVPSFFRCPISLDVMKSPVSLCTGVTYDRTSIQRWLDGGNNTCPATMQVLQTKDLVPNHTLQRLIQIWSDSVKTRQTPPPPPPSSVNSATAISLTHAEVKIIIQQLKTKLLENPPSQLSFIVQYVNKLILFAKQSDENCNYLSVADSEILPILISRFSKFSVNMQATEKFIQILHLLLKNYKAGGNEIFVVDEKFVAAMVLILRQGRLESRILVSKLLKQIADLRGEYRYLIGENEDVYGELLRLMISSGWDQEAMENCLSCLLSITMAPKRNRFRVVRGGAVIVLTKALCEGEMSVCLTEKALKLLEIVSTCKEGRNEISGNEKCVGAIVKKVLKVSNMATEHSVTILWSLCCLFRDQKAEEAVGKSNGMAKILLLLQSNVSPAIRQMCSDLLKVFRVNSKNSCLSSYDTKTTHIMPC